MEIQIKVCQRDIVKLDLQIKAKIQDIQRCEGSIRELSALNESAQDGIRDLKARIQELSQLAQEQDKEVDRVTLMKAVQECNSQLSGTQTSLRKANMMAQVSIEKQQRNQLFDDMPEVRKRSVSDKKELANSSSQITESLMSLTRLMADNVTHSEQTLGSLATSSQQISGTQDELKSMSGHIQISRRLLTKFSRRECTDKLLIFLALVFFFATVLYIVKKRVFS